jgi:triosephosphate isomerase (TIM)
MKSSARRPLVVANWKMNPTTPDEASRLFSAIRASLKKAKATIVVAPPAIYLSAMKQDMRKAPKHIALGAQNVHPLESGPHTGQLSVRMLYATGASYCIVGHSECRALGENDVMVNAKVHAILKSRMTPILCVGEHERDQSGKYYAVVEAEVRASLRDVKKKDIEKVVIAYEPIWAISAGDGKGKTATPEDAHEMRLFIVKVLTDLYGRIIAERMRVLYGGSVNETNAGDIFMQSGVDGFLVGGASLKPKIFARIVEAAVKK